MYMFDDTKNLGMCVRKIWDASDLDSMDYVLLLPHDDIRLNAMLRSVFEEKLGSRRGLVIDDERAGALIELYSLYALTDKLIIGSFDLPHGRKLRNFLDCNLIAEQELISSVILGVMDGAAV